VLEFLKADLMMANLCRKHDVTPGAFSKWRIKFIKGGKRSIESRGRFWTKARASALPKAVDGKSYGCIEGICGPRE
ncbi:MAG: hypothetical protein MI749_16410, partial [Desulfovibrionales bacterium]|nr:hypothetical protein [Desulfovibrionales bacterium]